MQQLEYLYPACILDMIIKMHPIDSFYVVTIISIFGYQQSSPHRQLSAKSQNVTRI